MNYSNLFVLGLLLLTANLSMGALFSPSHAGRTAADRLVLLWKILLLAAIQIGAWAIVLHQGGAAPSLLLAFTRATACFALMGGSGGGLAAPWGDVAPFIALNSPLYILVSILSLTRSNGAPQEPAFVPGNVEAISVAPETMGLEGAPGTTKVDPSNDSSVVQEKRTPATTTLSRPAARSVTAPPSNERGAGTGGTTGQTTAPDAVKSSEIAPSNKPPSTEPDFKPGGFRATIPKANSINAQLSPEEELAEQLKPIGPTPPPIRFEWKN